MNEAQLPGRAVGERELAHIRHRHAIASALAVGRVVLDVGCGAGVGLGVVTRGASAVVGADLSAGNLLIARAAHSDAKLVCCDATNLPFASESIDVVLALEVAQYVEVPHLLRELRRVVREDGICFLTMPNPDRTDFHPSSQSRRYYGVSEWREAASAAGLMVEVWGAFPEPSRLRRLVRAVWHWSLARAAGIGRTLAVPKRTRSALGRLAGYHRITLPASLESSARAESGTRSDLRRISEDDSSARDTFLYVFLAREQIVLPSFGSL